jgi:hypothetical protein
MGKKINNHIFGNVPSKIKILAEKLAGWATNLAGALLASPPETFPISQPTLSLPNPSPNLSLSLAAAAAIGRGERWSVPPLSSLALSSPISLPGGERRAGGGGERPLLSPL